MNGTHGFPILTAGALWLSAAAGVGQTVLSTERLVEQLAQESTRAEARAALVSSGVIAVPALLEVVEGPNAQPDHIIAALRTLERMGPDAVTAIPALCEVCVKLPRPARTALWQALAQIWPYDNEFWAMSRADLVQAMMPMIEPRRRQFAQAGVLPHWGTLQRIKEQGLDPRAPEPLIAGLRWSGGRDAVQDFILDALSRLGPQAASAAPKLTKQIRFPVPMHPAAEGEPRYLPLVETLLAVAPDAPEAATAHAYLLIYHGDPERRRRAAMAFGQHGDAARELVPKVLAGLDDSDLAVVRELVTSLGMLGQGAAEAIPRLEELVDHDDAQIATRAKAALRQIHRQ